MSAILHRQARVTVGPRANGPRHPNNEDGLQLIEVQPSRKEGWGDLSNAIALIYSPSPKEGR